MNADSYPIKIRLKEPLDIAYLSCGKKGRQKVLSFIAIKMGLYPGENQWGLKTNLLNTFFYPPKNPLRAKILFFMGTFHHRLHCCQSSPDLE